MKWPWQGKTGASKAIAVFATMLLLSAGLCGVNWAVVATFKSDRYLGAVIVSGLLESLGIAVGFVGLVIAIIVAACTKRKGDN